MNLSSTHVLVEWVDQGGAEGPERVLDGAVLRGAEFSYCRGKQILSG